jgi:hypothetical protein
MALSSASKTSVVVPIGTIPRTGRGKPVGMEYPAPMFLVSCDPSV